jgi:protein-S-isoprenylcysteine O-methyltransferase Ste14
LFDALARKRVFLGTIYLLVVVILPAPRANLWWIGLIIATFGELVRTWASGYLFKNETLARTGPFSIVRNPLYFGSFFLGWGMTLMGGQPILILAYPIIFLPLYVRRIEQEELTLVETFGDEARAYFASVPRLLPRLSGWRPAAVVWDIRRVVYVHREWGNWILLSLVAGWFWIKFSGAPHLP